jgi:anti-anti-sigma regulatory factor
MNPVRSNKSISSNIRNNKKDKNKIYQNIKTKRSIYSRVRKRRFQKIKHKNKGRTKRKDFSQVIINKSEKLFLPSIFSLRENTHETINFINNLKILEDTSKRIYLNMSKVKIISNGTIALLLSVVNDFGGKGKKIFGCKPKDPEARKTLELSGFFSYMSGRLEYNSDTNSNTIIEQGEKCVEPQKTSVIVRSAMKTILGKEARNKKLQGLFIELMANSVNHGFPNNENKKWIISASHFKKENYVSFSFIDNGVGILETLQRKIGERLLNIFKGKKDLLLSAFHGEIGSRTGLSFRGKGLPFILDKLNRNYISNLFILTNNVVLDYKTDKFYKIKPPYSGTFYYFEISLDNER